MARTRATTVAQTAPVPEVEAEIPPDEERVSNQPAHTIRLRNLRAAIWRNEGDYGPRYNTRIVRFFKDPDGDGWRTTDSLGRDDLLVAAELARLAFVWICETTQATEAPF
jgi:hypothetical protein